MDEALEKLKGANSLIVCKGKKVTTIDLKSEQPDRETLAALLLGPTGNLRAPTLVVGKTVIVGFNEEVYQEALSG